MHTFSGNKILVDLQAGKADILTEKFIEFDYGDDVVGQEYTAGDPIDPVYELKNGRKKIIAQHKHGHNYYAEDLRPAVFCKQSPYQQLISLFNTKICLEIKEKRLELLGPKTNLST